MEHNCKICNNSKENKIYQIKEMMFGFKDVFTYLECSNCECLQNIDIPLNIKKYYPSEYYSFEKIGVITNPIKKYLKMKLSEYYFSGKQSIIGYFLSKIHKPMFFEWLLKAELKYDSEILDVGCGNGQLLSSLSDYGFTKLTGVDPYMDSDIIYDNGVELLKRTIFEIDKKYGFIMLNHSFEHMTDPLVVLKQLYDILKPNGNLMLRIPIFPSYAWEKYGVDWFNLDAPRHYYLHSLKSIELLVENSNFQVTDIIYDSNESQFWGSEQYKKDIALHDQNSYYINKKLSLFSKNNINDFKLQADRLNETQMGDTVCIYLNK